MKRLMLVFVLLGLGACASSQSSSADSPPYVGKWLHTGIYVDGERVDEASSPYYVIHETGLMEAFKTPDAPIADERAWFEAIDEKTWLVIDDTNENSVIDDRERDEAERVTWAINGNKLKIALQEDGKEIAIVFERR